MKIKFFNAKSQSRKVAKIKKLNLLFSFFAPLRLFAFALILFFVSNAQAQIAVRGETVWTMAGEPVSNGVVLINNGKIEAVGTASNIKIPENYKIV